MTMLTKSMDQHYEQAITNTSNQPAQSINSPCSAA